MICAQPPYAIYFHHTTFEINQRQLATRRKDLLASEIAMKASSIRPIVHTISKRTVSRRTNSAPVRECRDIITCRSQTVLGAGRSRAIICNNPYADTSQSNCTIGHRRTRPFVAPNGIGEGTQRRYASQSSGSGTTLQQTALHDLHVARGGKMVPFGGYSMPVQYEDLGVGESHKWTREKASLFDVGHM